MEFQSNPLELRGRRSAPLWLARLGSLQPEYKLVSGVQYLYGRLEQSGHAGHVFFDSN